MVCAITGVHNVAPGSHGYELACAPPWTSTPMREWGRGARWAGGLGLQITMKEEKWGKDFLSKCLQLFDVSIVLILINWLIDGRDWLTRCAVRNVTIEWEGQSLRWARRCYKMLIEWMFLKAGTAWNDCVCACLSFTFRLIWIFFYSLSYRSFIYSWEYVRMKVLLYKKACQGSSWCALHEKHSLLFIVCTLVEVFIFRLVREILLNGIVHLLNYFWLECARCMLSECLLRNKCCFGRSCVKLKWLFVWDVCVCKSAFENEYFWSW